ncbi:DUF2589 domain-containing protein [Citromicrobium bathyomarinum]|uniref:DUF2589 domain-containing protein n=1 Tax=Citromicrobium bathyomarinum TaxID=72174 RepID=UPI00315AF3C0
MPEAPAVPGPALASMAQQFAGLPMPALIGGPLMAACSANQQMALTQIDFLMKTCFVEGDDSTDKGKSYAPVMVNMTLSQGIIVPPAEGSTNPTVSHVDTTIQVPLLTILPLNSLAVDNVTINFDMEVKSSFTDDTSSSTSSSTKEDASFDAKAGWGMFSVEIKGSVSHDSSSASSDQQHYSKSNDAKYSVTVHAGQLPLPPGVTTIIQAMTSTMAPIQLPAGPAKDS